MKEEYQNAQMDLLEFVVEDVITTSDKWTGNTWPSRNDQQRPDYGAWN